MKLSIIIPAYNERNTIQEIVRRVRAVDLGDLDKEILVVDDGSTDGTRDILRMQSDSVTKVILHENNQGKAAAVRTGMAAATGDLIVVQDADLEYDPEDYPKLIDPVLKGKAQVVYGSRFTGERRNMLFWHYVGNRFLSLVTNVLYNTTLSDMETCYKLFTREALAGLVDHASRLAEDQKRLTLSFTQLRGRMIEAAAIARAEGQELVSERHLARAVAENDFRANLFEEEFMADYDREIIKVATGGHAVGRANGLSVTLFGDYEFGLPHQISCTVGVGHGGILDLEREAQLGGPIHTKGMMIIKSYLVRLFAQDKPVVLTGSLCFEQNYAGVEGDSASGAELAALLSALSGAPIDLSLAFTGAVSQSGAIMAVGGVSRKVEGFFEVCRRRGLTGNQGVLFPADNAVHLLLKDEVVEAVREGQFHLYPVATIEQAMTLLIGLSACIRR